MVQIIENWTDVIGVVTDVHPSAGDLCVVRIDVDGSEAVAGFPSLVAPAAGQSIEVFLGRADAERIGIAPGMRIRTRIRLTASGAFAHPDETHVA